MKKNKTRLSIDLTPDAKEQLEQVQTKSRAGTLIEVFRKAIAVYEMILDQQAANGKVVLENADGSREVVRLI